MSKTKKNVCVLLSGRGSNLKSLIEHAINYEIVSVISNIPSAPGLEIGRSSKIPTTSVPREAFSSLKNHKQAIYAEIEKLNPDFIVLAGFMQIVDPSFVEHHFGKIINIHPSLLPKFPGLHTHEQALSNNAKVHGCSVHFVDPGVDTGPVIAQAEVPINTSDTPDSLGARVLTREHEIYPWVVNHLCDDQIQLISHRVTYSTDVRAEAKKLNFILPKF